MGNVTIRVNVAGAQQVQQLIGVLQQYNSALTNVAQGQSRVSASSSIPAGDVAAFNANVGKMIVTLNEATKASKGFGETFTNSIGSIAKGYLIFQGIAVVFGTITRAVHEATEATFEYQKEVARSLRAPGSDPAPGQEQFAAGTLRMGTALSGRSIKDTGEVLYQLSTFIKDTDTRALAFNDTMKLLTGTEGNARETTRLLVQTFSQFRDTMDPTQTDAQKLHSVAELIATSFKNANAEVGELAQSLKYLGPTAQAAHIPLEQVFGIVTALSGEGQRGRLAGTEVTSLVMNILKNYDAKQGGIVHKGEVFEFKLERNMSGANKGGIDLVGTLRNISNILQHMNREEGEKWAMGVAGTTQAYRALGTEGTTAIRNLIDQTKQMTEATHGQSQALEHLYEEMQKPIQTKGIEAWNAALGIMSTLIDTLLRQIPGLNNALDNVRNLGIELARTQQEAGAYQINITNATGRQRASNELQYLSTLRDAMADTKASRDRINAGQGGTSAPSMDDLAIIARSIGHPERERAYAEGRKKTNRITIADAFHIYEDAAGNTSPNARAELLRVIGRLPKHLADSSSVPNYQGSGPGEQEYISLSELDKEIAKAQRELIDSPRSSPHTDEKRKIDPSSHRHKAASKGGRSKEESIARKAVAGLEAQLTEIDEMIDDFRDTHSLKDTYQYMLSVQDKYVGILEKIAQLETIFAPEKAKVDKRALRTGRDRFHRGYIKPSDRALFQQSIEVQRAQYEALAANPYLNEFDPLLGDVAIGLDTADIREANASHDPVKVLRASQRARQKAFEAKVRIAKKTGDYPFTEPEGDERAMFDFTPNQRREFAVRGAQSLIEQGTAEISLADRRFRSEIRPISEEPGGRDLAHNAELQDITRQRIEQQQAQQRIDAAIENYEAVAALDKSIEALTLDLRDLQKAADDLVHEQAIKKYVQSISEIDRATAQKQFRLGLEGFRHAGEDPIEYRNRARAAEFTSIQYERERYDKERQKFNETKDHMTPEEKRQSQDTLLGIKNNIESSRKSIEAGDAAIYNEMHDNLQRTFQSAISGIYHGTTSPLQAVASIGDIIVEKLLEKTFQPVIDPLVNSLTEEMLHLDDVNIQLIRLNTNLESGLLTPGGGLGGDSGTMSGPYGDLGPNMDPNQPGVPSGNEPGMPGGGYNTAGGKWGKKGSTLSNIGMGVAAYSVFKQGEQTGPLQGAVSGAMAGAAFGPIGAAVGGVVGLLGGLFGGGKKAPTPQENQAAHNPATTNAPSDFEYAAYRYRATASMAVGAPLDKWQQQDLDEMRLSLDPLYKQHTTPAPIVNVYMDGVKAATREVLERSAGSAAMQQSVAIDYHKPI